MPLDDGDFRSLQEAFNTATTDLNKGVKSALDEARRAGDLSTETKAAVDKLLTQQGEAAAEMSARVAEVEQRLSSRQGGVGDTPRSLGGLVVHNAADRIKQAAQQGVSGDFSLGVFNAITALPGSAGALKPEVTEAEIVRPERRKLRIRNLVTNGATTAALIKYFREVSTTGAAGFVPDDGVTVKPLIDKTFVSASTEVVTIAGRMEIHKHMLDDIPALRTDIDETLTYEVEKAEDAAILAGDGTGEMFTGLIPSATAYAMAAREVTPVTVLDRLRLAILQTAAAGYVADGLVLSIFDWGRAELLKDTTGRYIFGNPAAGEATPRLWGRPVVDTEVMPEGDFLVGDFRRAATYYQRQGVEVLLSSENRDNFDKNMLTVRGEKRAALAVKRPLALCYYNGA